VMWTDYRTTNSEIFYKHGRPGGSPVEEASQSAAGRLPAAMVRGRFDSPGTAVLVDASGRPATTVRSGPNRLDGLAPGVYLLYPIEGGVRCRKLVIVE